MRPPMNPEHVEAVHSVGSDSRMVQASCSCGWTSTTYIQGSMPGRPTVARLLANELNTHRATYTDTRAGADTVMDDDLIERKDCCEAFAEDDCDPECDCDDCENERALDEDHDQRSER